jgi:predicted ABC-type ATPase
MKTRRLRIFAGPNGSGKSTVLRGLSEKKIIDLGIYLNADDIEKILNQESILDLSRFGINQVSTHSFKTFLKNHSLIAKAKSDGFTIDLDCQDNFILSNNENTHSYESALIVDFIRQILISKGKKFTFETVMSHPSKIEILKHANEEGYKNYLYFIATSDVMINKTRVEERVNRGGHQVPEDKIENRYLRSLGQVKEAIKYTHRAFIFDNSGSEAKLILSIYKGKEATIKNTIIPPWVNKYILT